MFLWYFICCKSVDPCCSKKPSWWGFTSWAPNNPMANGCSSHKEVPNHMVNWPHNFPCATRTGTNESPSRNRLILGPIRYFRESLLGRKCVTHGALGPNFPVMKAWVLPCLACSQPAWKREHHRCREALLPPTTKLTRLASGMWNCP